MDAVSNTSALDFGPLLKIRRFWAAPPYFKALEDGGSALIEGLSECLEKLRRNPRQPGLNCKTLSVSGMWSCRISEPARLIFARLSAEEVVLLYFTDDHDEYDRWPDRHATQLQTYIERRSELRPVGAAVPPIRGPLRDEADILPLPSDDVLQRMLKDGMASYVSFLDEHQRDLAELSIHELNGPTLVKGGAGTGKTALAIARLRYLAQEPEMGYGRVLYLCFNRMLRMHVDAALRWQYGGRYPWEHIDVQTVHEWCGRYLGDTQVTSKPWEIRHKMARACGTRSAETIERFSEELNAFLRPLGVEDLTSYIKLERRGAGASLDAKRREEVWIAYERYKQDRSIVEYDDLPVLALERLGADRSFIPYRAVVVDEGQDFSPVMIRLAKALVGGDERRLFVLADIAQSIYPSGFYWSQREIGVRGRQVKFLRSSYRNTTEVQALARSLYSSDAEIRGEVAETNDAQRHGAIPRLFVASTENEEREFFAGSLAHLLESGEARPEQIAVLAYSIAVLREAERSLQQRGVPTQLVSGGQRSVRPDEPQVKLTTVHQSKGLDFPFVYLTGIYASEISFMGSERRRALLYVGITRASKALTLTTVLTRSDPLLHDLDPSLVVVEGPAALRWETTVGDGAEASR
jgi:superfamily I DNA/RNA helicase